MVPPSSRQTGRWRFSVAVLGPVAICLIATAAASLGFVLWSAHNEDQRALARQEALARHIIELQLDRIPHDQQSVTIWDDAAIAFAVGWPGTEMPYSVSMPITRRTLTRPAYGLHCHSGAARWRRRVQNEA